MGYGFGPIFNHHKLRYGYTTVGATGEEIRPPVMFKELGVNWQRDFIISGNQKQIVRFLMGLGDIPVKVPEGQKRIYLIVRGKAAKIRDELAKATGGLLAGGSGVGSFLASNVSGLVAEHAQLAEPVADLVSEATSFFNALEVPDKGFEKAVSKARGPHAIIRLSAAQGTWHGSHKDASLALPVEKDDRGTKEPLTAGDLGRVVASLSL